jgi:hypothetical protein
VAQSEVDGFRGAAGAEDEGSRVVWLQERTDAVHEADDVGVESLQMGTPVLACDADDVTLFFR